MADLIYTESLGKTEIRIAWLVAGQPDDPVRCFLIPIEIGQSVDFEALSYEWKTELGHMTIFCNDVALEVTLNLAHALISMRRQDMDRLLWIDAICINQTNAEEKSMQIQLMTDIYASATSVVAWLGPSFDGVREAFEMFPHLAQLAAERDPHGHRKSDIMEFWIHAKIKRRPQRGSLLQSNHDRGPSICYVEGQIVNKENTCEELSDDEIFRFSNLQVWQAVDELFSSSYFYRAWIFQEIGVARNLRIQCGTQKIRYEIFLDAWRGRGLLSFQFGAGATNLDCVQRLRNTYRAKGNCNCAWGLAEILFSFDRAEQTDARDRIYAAKGFILPTNVRQVLVPDYSKSLSEVFYDAMSHVLRHEHNLSIWTCGTTRSKRSLLGLPTWVPEWTMPSDRAAGAFCNPAFAECLAGNYVVEDKTLLVDGLLLDEICEVFPIKGLTELMVLVSGLGKWLKSNHRSLFSDYAMPCPESTHFSRDERRLRTDALNMETLLNDHGRLPKPIATILRELDELRRVRPGVKDPLTNIDSMWLVLTSDWDKYHESRKCCHDHLFAALLYVLSRSRTNDHEPFIDEYASYVHQQWIHLVVQLMISPQTEQFGFEKLMSELGKMRYSRDTEDYFFVTKKGHFGRASASDVEVGHWVAMLGGAWAPCLLEERGDHFELVCQAYVEGIMTMSKLGPAPDIQTLVLR